jgi:hypothetical protein
VAARARRGARMRVRQPLNRRRRTLGGAHVGPALGEAAAALPVSETDRGRE